MRSMFVGAILSPSRAAMLLSPMPSMQSLVTVAFMSRASLGYYVMATQGHCTVLRRARDQRQRQQRQQQQQRQQTHSNKATPSHNVYQYQLRATALNTNNKPSVGGYGPIGVGVNTISLTLTARTRTTIDSSSSSSSVVAYRSCSSCSSLFHANAIDAATKAADSSSSSSSSRVSNVAGPSWLPGSKRDDGSISYEEHRSSRRSQQDDRRGSLIEAAGSSSASAKYNKQIQVAGSSSSNHNGNNNYYNHNDRPYQDRLTKAARQSPYRPTKLAAAPNEPGERVSRGEAIEEQHSDETGAGELAIGESDIHWNSSHKLRLRDQQAANIYDDNFYDDDDDDQGDDDDDDDDCDQPDWPNYTPLKERNKQRARKRTVEEWRVLWRAARNHQQTDHYDYSLYGLSTDLDRAVAQHQRQAMLYNQDRHLKEEQAKQVAPNMKQSPISLMTINPAYEPQSKPLILEYPTTVENLRISNTGFSWEVKIPYQISMTTALYGAHLHRYRLDQFHCHWGSSEQQGSEHTVDGVYYSAEMHFVHYNMERYHTMSKAARHPDGLVVLAVFLDAQPNHHNHAELDKIVSNLKLIPLKGDHAIIKQAVRIENLLPANRSYWSYQGSLTTPPYLESVTWFVLKQPIKCSTNQIERFRALKSNLRSDDEEQVFIRSNFRKTQPLNGRTIISYDEPNGAPIKSPASGGGVHYSNSSSSSASSATSSASLNSASARQSSSASHH